MPALRVTNVSEAKIVPMVHLRYRTFEHTKSADFCKVPRPSQHTLLREKAEKDKLGK